MKSVFISGSISIKKLPNIVCESFDKIIAQNIHIYLGDADGVDILAQNYFASKNYTNITICTIKEYPRNIASNTFKIKQIKYDSSIKSERERQTFKDEFMTGASDYSFVIWDGKSKGSFANIKRAIENNKKLKVYYLLFDRCLEKDELSLKNLEDIYKSNIYRVNDYGNKTGQGLKTDLISAKASLSYLLNRANNVQLELSYIQRLQSNGGATQSTNFMCIGIRTALANFYNDF